MWRTFIFRVLESPGHGLQRENDRAATVNNVPAAILFIVHYQAATALAVTDDTYVRS